VPAFRCLPERKKPAAAANGQAIQETAGCEAEKIHYH
jgi:hypothetical protein